MLCDFLLQSDGQNLKLTKQVYITSV